MRSLLDERRSLVTLYKVESHVSEEEVAAGYAVPWMQRINFNADAIAEKAKDAAKRGAEQ